MNKRRFIRYQSDRRIFARIDTNVHRKVFQPDLVALVLDVSPGGCGLVVLATENLKIRDQCVIQIAEEDPTPAEIAWRVDLDEQVIKLGVRYIEES